MRKIRLYGISIHALRVEGDIFSSAVTRVVNISIHALRVEGDISVCTAVTSAEEFLSTPSGWRATEL